MTAPYIRLSNKIKSANTMADIIDALTEHYHLNDVDFHGYAKSNNIATACRSGCSFCCNFQVKARPYEIFVISEYIKHEFSEAQKNEAIKSLKEHKVHLSEITEVQHVSMNVRCPLLVNDVCSVYLVRPFSCREYTSLDVASCQYSFENPDDLVETRPTHQDLDALWKHVVGNVYSIFQNEGYDVSPHELGTSLLESMSDSKHHKRWRKKKKALLGLHAYLNG